ncbi:MAG: polyphenol oxidase family protein [bacterium]
MTPAQSRASWSLAHAGEVPYITFDGLDEFSWIVHGLSVVWGGDPERSGQPLRRALCDGSARFVSLRQVHGADVIAIAHGDASPARAPGEEWCAGDADGLATDVPGLALEIRVADCVPLFAVDPVRRAIGLAHAGWRGTIAGVGAQLVAALGARFGTRPDELHIWIGPSIGPECFEVGPEVAAAFRDAFGAEILPDARHVDLHAAHRLAFARAGLREAHLHTVDLCTVCRRDLLHSHRGSGGTAGRNLAILAIRP